MTEFSSGVGISADVCAALDERSQAIDAWMAQVAATVFGGSLRALRAVPWAEVSTYAAFLVGWLCVTAGVAHLTAPVTWWFSLGLLALSVGGIKPLAVMAWHGLYALTRESE